MPFDLLARHVVQVGSDLPLFGDAEKLSVPLEQPLLAVIPLTEWPRLAARNNDLA